MTCLCDYVPHNESVPDLKVKHLTILLSTDHNLIKHQQRLTENFKFKMCIMILESLIQAIFYLDFLLNIQYGYRR